MIVEDVGFEFGLTPTVPSQESAQVVLDHDYGFDGALFVGYDLRFRSGSRPRSPTRARIDDIEAAIQLPGTPSLGGVGPGGAIQPDVTRCRAGALSFMVNGLLDFGDDDGISGFVGGGVGIARVDYNNIRAFANQGAFVDDSDTRFAWQIVAGVRQAITDNIDVTVRYRFFNADDIRTVDFRGFESESRFRCAQLAGWHHLTSGLRSRRFRRRLRRPRRLRLRLRRRRRRRVVRSGAVHRVLRLE